MRILFAIFYRKQGMDGQLYCESHLPTSPVSGPVTPTTPVSPTGGDEKKKVSLLTFNRT